MIFLYLEDQTQTAMKKDKKEPSKEISNSKNVISDSNIEAGGNVHIGDTFNINLNPQKQAEQKEGLTPASADQIRKLIASNRLDKAIDQLMVSAKNVDEDLHDQVIHQSQRWKQLKREDRLGLLTGEQAGLRNNRIVAGLLGILTELEKM